jgi:hypothetical protein
MNGFIMCTPHQILLGISDEEGRDVACMGHMRNACEILVGYPEGKKKKNWEM